MAHSFWFNDDLLISAKGCSRFAGKNLITNKRKKGGGYIAAMLLKVAVLFQMFKAMLPWFALMLHAANLICFKWGFLKPELVVNRRFDYDF